MAESRQSIIEIPDCDYLVFQEFLRFLYCYEIEGDENLVFNLFAFADKYVQPDLNEKCLNFLKEKANPDNIYIILDFARRENISHLKSWCLNFLRSTIDASNRVGNRPAIGGKCRNIFEITDISSNIVGPKSKFLTKIFFFSQHF